MPEKPVKPLKPIAHGERKGAMMHRRRGIELCAACREAENKERRDRYHAKQERESKL